MMPAAELEKLCARMVAASETHSEPFAPLQAAAFAQGLLALNSLATSFARVVESITEAEPEKTEPETAPIVGTPDPEPEPVTKRSGALWRGRNGIAVDGDEFSA